MDSRQSPVLRTARSRLSVAISLAALGIAASLVSAPVLALCSPGSPTGGETLTCDLIDTDYFASANNLTFEIKSGALVTSGTTGTPSMFLNGDSFTINNRGTIDSASGGFATTSTTALKIWSTGVGPITVNNLLTNSPIRGSAAIQTGPLASLDGMALDIRNGVGSLITVDNKGVIMAVRVAGNTATTTDIPVVALYGGGQISMINSGTITGRVAFESSAAGNTFTNIGALNGSLSMGAAGGNRFNAVTNSSISTFGGIAGTLTNTAGINLEFAPTGVVDGGVAGNNGLYLQNAPNGGFGSTGTGTIYAASYINFSNLQVISGTWTVNGALLTGTTTSAGLSGGELKVNNNAVFGSGDVTVNGATITANAASLVLANKFTLGANYFSGLHGLTVNGTNALTIDGVISGMSVATLTKNDAGVLRLNGVNTYSGTTYLNGGTLIAGSNLAFGTSLLSVGPGGKIEGVGTAITNNIDLTGGATFGGSGDLSVAGIIGNTGPQSITKSGSGALTLSNANTFQGGTLLSAGTLSVGNNQALGSGDLTVDGASTLTSTRSVTLNNKVALAANLTVGGDNNITLNNVVSGGPSAKLIKTGNGNLVLGGTNNFQGGIELKGGTVTASNNNGGLGSGTLTVTGNGRLVYGTAMLAMTPIVINSGKTLEFSNDVSVLYNGLISGDGDLVKTGSDSLDLYIATTLSGLVDVRQGTLKSAVPNALGNNPSLNIDSGASVKIDYGAGIKSLTGVGEITVNSGPLIIGNGNASSTFDGVISGPGAVSKTGTGLLTLSGVSSHTGTITVNGGRLDIASGASLASSSVTVNNGGSISGRGTLSNALVINNGGHLALSSGSTLTSGALTLSSGSIVDIALGAPTIATPMAKVNGDLVINASPIFNFTDAGNMANGTYRLFDYTGLLTYTGGTLGTLPPGILAGEVQLEVGQSKVVNIIVNSALLARQYWDGTPSPANGNIDGGSGVWTAGNANWTNASGLSNDVWKGVSAVFQNGSGTVSIQGTHTLSALLFKSDGYVLYADPNNGLSLVNGTGGSALVTVDSSNTATLDTPLVGAGKLEKSGAGTLVLTRSNSYSGGTALTAGTLLVRDDNALGNGALSLASGTTLRSDRVEAQLANNLTVTGASNIDVASGTLRLNGVVSGAGGLVKAGAGTLVLNGNNAQLGNTSLTAGGLVLGSTSALGGGVLTTSSNTTLDSGLAGVQIGSNVAVTGNLTFLGSRDMSLTGVVSGSGNLIKSGSSTLSLTGANSLNGTVTLNQGTLRLGQSAALGNASLVVGGASSLEAGGNVSVAKTVNLQANLTVTGANDLTFSDALYGTGGLIKDGSGTLILSALNLYQGTTTLKSGTVLLGGTMGTGQLNVTGSAAIQTLAQPLNQAVTLDNANVAIDGDLTLNTAGRLVMSGSVSGAGSLTKTGAETLSLTNSSTFQGIYNINGGSLSANFANRLGNPTQVNIASGASLLLANGGTAAQLSGAGSVQVGSGDFSVGAGTFSGDMSATSGSGGLVKFGNGTLSLSGNNTLNTIVVDGGTLRFNGQGSASVTVQNGAMLTGSGALSGGVTIANGGHLGLAAGSVLDLHSLVLNDTSNLDVALGAAISGAAGLANVRQGLTLDGKLNITDTGGFGLGIYRLFDYSGSLVDHGLQFGALPTGVLVNELDVQTSVAHQVNLVVGSPDYIRFWDGSELTGNGSIEGGNGLWNSGNSNWTTINAGLNGTWNDSFAVFQGAAGTVTVDGTQRVNGLQFINDYSLAGGVAGQLQLVNSNTGYTTVRVDNGKTATLDVNLSGNGILNKLDSGTLVLNGSNSHTAGTRLTGGTLVLGNDAALGSGNLTTSAATTLDSNKAVSLGNDLAVNGALTLAGSHDLSLNGLVQGSGTLVKNGSATLTLNQANGHAGTTLNAGKLVLGNSGALGTGQLDIAGVTSLDTRAAMTLGNAINFGVDSASSLTLAGLHDLTLSGALSGNGSLVKQGASTLDLTGSSHFNGAYQIDAGRLNLLGSNGANAPQISVGSGATLGVGVDSTLHQLSGQGAVQLYNNSALTLRNGTYAGNLGGAGSLNIASGIVALTGVSNINGATSVSSGTLFAHGALTTSSLSVASGATLGGKGSVDAAVTIADGGHLQLLRSNSLTTGNLTLNNSSNLDAVLGAAVAGDAGMIKVNGNLVLDGKLNVTDAGGFGIGVYRLIDYTGALTDNGLELGVIPANLLTSELALQSSIDKQVNLVVGGGADLRFWGGSGSWNSTSSNWATSSGGANQLWNSSFGVFQGAPGVVSVEGAQRFSGLQFVTDGYQLVAATAGELVAVNSPSGHTVIRVDSASLATLDVAISGSGTLAKLDSGTLVLNGTNRYSGGTRLEGGTLVLGNNGALGSGSLSVGTGTRLDSNTVLNVGNSVLLNGDLNVAGSHDLTLSGQLTGSGGLIKHGASVLRLDGSNSYQGRTVLNAGTLVLGHDTALGSSGLVANGSSTLLTAGVTELKNTLEVAGNLTLSSADALALSGRISGNGTLIKDGAGRLDVLGSNDFNGLYSVNNGRLNLLGSGHQGTTKIEIGAAGSLGVGVSSTVALLNGQGAVVLADNSQLSVSGGTYSGAISGSGSLNKTGSGSLVLSGVSTISGASHVAEGSLYVNGAGVLGSAALTVASGASLGGTGSISGAVSIADGGHLLVNSGSTLTTGALTLNNASSLDAFLGAAVPGGAGLLKVNGNLVLDGRLTISNVGGFGLGVYRLIDYTGSLTDNGLALGTLPAGLTAGDLHVQTSVGNQVNLVVGGAADGVLFWGGNAAGNGGSGVWGGAASNWSNASGNFSQGWNDGFAVFQGSAGTVTVEGSQTTTGLQFIADGYVLAAGNAGALNLLNSSAGYAGVRVNSGSTATVNVNLSGSGTLNKLEAGTLVLNGSNSYSGGTRLEGGTLLVGSNTALGSGTLTATNASVLDSNRAVTLGNAVALDGNLLVGGSNALGLSGVISGSGALVKNGAANLTLSGNNSYSGGTVLNAGSLTLGHSAALGSAALSVLGNTGLDTSGTLHVANAIGLGAQLTLGGSHDLTLSGALSGNGNLIKNGNGQLLLSGNSSYTGNTVVNAGNLTVNGSVASANVQLANGASLAGSGTLSGKVSLANGASLNVASATAPLTVGGLSLASASNLNFALGAPNSQAAVVKVNGDLTLDGTLNVSNAGGFGFGVYQLFSYGGVLTDNGLSLGSLPSGFFAAQMTLQTALANQINLVVGEADGSLLFWNGDKTNADGSIAGGNGVWGPDTNWTNSTGSSASNWAGRQFAVFGGQSGTVTVQGARTFSGMQFLGDGYQLLGGEGNSLEAINAADGRLAGIRVAGASSTLIGAQLVGSGGIEKLDGGTLVLTGNNTYSGGTLVSGGTLSGSTTSLQGSIVNNASLIFQQDVDGRFSGTLDGTGAAFKRGAGTLLFTGNNDFSGTFSVDQGVLQVGETAASQPVAAVARFARLAAAPVGATLAADISVAKGAGLTGTGTVASVTNHGIVAPGPNGNLTVSGNFTNAGDGTLSINLTPLPTRYLAIGGTANLAGTLNVFAVAPYTGDTTYTLLTAGGGVSGRFDNDSLASLGVASSLAFISTSLNYGSNDVSLSVARNGTAFTSVALNDNQRGVAAALDSAAAPASLHSQIVSMDRASAQAAFDSLSGEIHASTASVLLEDSRYLRNTVNERMRQSDCGNHDPRSVLAPNGSQQQSSSGCQGQGVGWLSAIGGWSEHDGSHAAASVDRDLSGFMMGFDNNLNDQWRAGVAAGYTKTSLDARQRGSDASVDSYHLTTYLSYQADALAARLGAGYSWHSIDTKRNVVAGGYSDELKAKYKAGTAQVFGEVGYTLEAAGVALEPFAGIAYANYDSDSGREKGGAGRLQASAKQDATFTTVGLRLGKQFTLDNGTTVTPRGSLGWRHAFGDTQPDADLRFVDGGAAFSSQGVPLARDAAVLEAGLDVSVGAAGKLGLGYSGQLSSDNRDHAMTVSFSLGF